MTLEKKDQKLRELVLYIAQRSRDDQAFGITKQNKLLFYADFLAYLRLGLPLTQQEYIKLPQGPAPKRWPLLREQLLANGDLAIQKLQCDGAPQYRPVPQRKPDLSVFTSKQIKLVDEVIQMHWTQTEAQITNDAHGVLACKLAKIGDTIPYPKRLSPGS